MRIFRGPRLLRTIWTPLRDTNPFRLSQLDLKVPRSVHGRLGYSVRSLDAAGNRSNRAWASLVVHTTCSARTRFPLTTAAEAQNRAAAVKRHSHEWFASAAGAATTASAAIVAAAKRNRCLIDPVWNGYRWARTSNPFTLKLGDNVNRLWDGMLITASGHWTQATPLNTTIVSGSTRPKACKATLGRVEVCSERYGNTGWLGVATIWLQSGTKHIVQ